MFKYIVSVGIIMELWLHFKRLTQMVTLDSALTSSNSAYMSFKCLRAARGLRPLGQAREHRPIW